MKTPIEMLNAIIEMQEANYGNGMNTHMELSTLVKEAKEVVKNCSIPNVRLLLPNTKEVDEAAESFGDLYSLDGQFANGCESGWKAGAEWMRDKVNEQLGNES